MSKTMPQAPKKIKILICGILPPPNFGHSMVYKMLMASSFPEAFDTRFLNMQFWTYGAHKKVTIDKLFKLIKYYAVFVWMLLFWRPKYILYNSSFYKMPFLKDFLFCSTGIVLGSRVVFHDLGQYVRELDDSLTGFKKSGLRWMLKNMGGASLWGGRRCARITMAWLTNRKFLSFPAQPKIPKRSSRMLLKTLSKLMFCIFHI